MQCSGFQRLIVKHIQPAQAFAGLARVSHYSTRFSISTAIAVPTAINAPRGLNERIYHVWRRDGGEVERIALDIHGGRKEGYRAWTHKKNFPTDAVGRWQVQVLTEAGQIIGVLRFKVVE